MAATIDKKNIPDTEIEKIIQFHDSLAYEELAGLLDTTIQKISTWLSSVHVSVFTLERDLKAQESSVQNEYSTDGLEEAMRSMDPIIQLLPELSDVLEQQCDEQQQLEYTTQITKLQSEWSSLQHFLHSVKNLLFTQRETFKLQSTIEHLLLQIDQLSIMLFDFQEKKYQSFALPTSSSLSDSSSTDNTTIASSTNTTDDFHKEDQMMIDIDQHYEPLLERMEYLYQTIASVQDPMILKRFQKLKDKWEALQFDRDDVKSEQKEDRWLTVFKRVADQVDIMIDGLDRSVIQCYSFIQQVKKNNNHSTTTSSRGSFFFLKRNKPASPIIQVDKEKFRSVEKSFEAKYKYYTPSIDRMLGMLGNGIATRASKDNQTSQRHESMLQRWHHLKEAMDDLRLKDLVDTERILFSGTTPSSNGSHHSASPTNTHFSDQQTHWKSIRYRTPEPTMDRGRSVTPNSTTRRNSLGRYSNLQHDSASDASSTTSSLKLPRTPKPSRSIVTHDFYEEDEKDFGLDISNFTKQQQQLAAGKNAGLRSKSSLGHMYTSGLSPQLSRRSVTPSLIPRPKTPSKQQRMQSRLGLNTPPVPPLPKQQKGYIPDLKDPLDVEVSKIINASPVPIQCQRASVGRYYFGNESSVSVNGGKKLYACKLMTYTDRKRKGNGQNKVLIRVGGGWQELEFFLLDHSSFMSSNTPVPVKKAVPSSWRN